MDLYIDGDFKIPSEFKSSKNKFYSSIYSSTNQTYANITPSPAFQLSINTDAFDEVIDFYNERESIFNKFENSVFTIL
ncbi:MAG: hypothetical protein AB8B72_09990 [Crocinitomicaceae bacterium]